MTKISFGEKNREKPRDLPKPDPKFTALDDSTKIQLEIERQTLTQTIDSLKVKLDELDKKEKTGKLEEADEDERDRLREQLDSLYRQRNDLLERIQKKIDEKSSNRKPKEERADAKPNKESRDDVTKKSRQNSGENFKKSSSNPRKFPKVSDEV